VSWALVYLIGKFEHKELLSLGRRWTGDFGGKGNLIGADDSILCCKSA
jgi:hypothetical protein